MFLDVHSLSIRQANIAFASQLQRRDEPSAVLPWRLEDPDRVMMRGFESGRERCRAAGSASSQWRRGQLLARRR
jgi:hypothetical protein